MEREVLVENEEEKHGIYRQVCRLNCSGLGSNMMSQVIKCYRDILKEVKLLDFRDRKNNNVLHLILKGIKKEQRF